MFRAMIESAVRCSAFTMNWFGLLPPQRGKGRVPELEPVEESPPDRQIAVNGRVVRTVGELRKAVADACGLSIALSKAPQGRLGHEVHLATALRGGAWLQIDSTDKVSDVRHCFAEYFLVDATVEIEGKPVSEERPIASILGISAEPERSLCRIRFLAEEEFDNTNYALRSYDMPVLSYCSVILKPGEVAHFEAYVDVVEQRTETRRMRGYVGTRLKVGKVPLFVGGSAPVESREEVRRSIGDGKFVITNQRVIVAGTKANYSIRLDSILGIKASTDAIQILNEGKTGGRFYRVSDPDRAERLLEAAIKFMHHGEQERAES